VQHWFKSRAREENIDAGRHLLEKEFKRLALTSVDYQRIAKTVQFATVEDMFAVVGSGEMSSGHVLNAAQGLVGKLADRQVQPSEDYPDQVEVQGAGNLPTHIAGCCNPLPGDTIAGFITRGNGVSIHRADCARILSSADSTEARIIEVEWGVAPPESYEVDVVIEAYDRHGLLRDITGLFASARINVLSINTITNKQSNSATMRLHVEVPSLASLSKLLERIDRLKNVVSAVRISE
jgi:GTP pyrophosphokinase